MLENEAGQDTPVVDNEAQNPEAEQVNAAPANESTETPEGEEKQAPVEKTFTQKELDEIIQKRIAKAEAKAERRATQAYREALEAVTRQQPAPQRQGPAEPTRDQFASDADWIDAKVEFKLQQRESAARAEAQRSTQQSLNSKTEAIYSQAEKVAGFDREAFDELPLTKTIAAALIESDVAPQLMAYMSANPEDVERIAKLSDARQAVELGKLEARLQAAPKTTNAKPPISPVGAKGSTPSNPSEMSMAEYKAWRAKQGARWAR